jgi:hypothetical protein
MQKLGTYISPSLGVKMDKNNEFDSRLVNLVFIILYFDNKTSRKGSRGPGDEVRRS